MILNNAPLNEAIVSNVSETGGFRIKQSAKAFTILSSSLYANKIKAIIRELSCNALDSHIAAGKTDVPFEVHLPSTLEAYFSVRDFGIGLDHDQVMNLYTTYFESTKSDSNEYVGALGLGSKSPFSYTENFTVTAIKDGIKRIYTAYINEQGTPAIALMDTSETPEENGVEVRFAVDNRNDFHSFAREAQYVFKYFDHHPKVIGGSYSRIERNYLKENLIPGVHISNETCLVMGNICYPIDISIMKNNIDSKYHHLCTANLEINLPLGSVEFQPSREGLSYVKHTITAIEEVLAKVDESLYGTLKSEADAIENFWERAEYLIKVPSIFHGAVSIYVNKTKFPLIEFAYNSPGTASLKLYTDDLKKKYNLTIRAFSGEYNRVCSNINPRTENVPQGGGNFHVKNFWDIPARAISLFVRNDTNKGIFEASKYHSRTNNMRKNVYVMDAFDSTKPVLYDEFLKSIYNPPNILLASQLDRKPTTTRGKGGPVPILEYSSVNKYRSRDYTWSDIHNVEDIDDPTKTFYYVRLSGYNVLTDDIVNIEDFFFDINEAFPKLQLYGVRKSSIEEIKTRKNWVEVTDYISKCISKLTDDDLRTCGLAHVPRIGMGFLNLNRIENIDLPDEMKTMLPLIAKCHSRYGPNSEWTKKNKIIKNHAPKTFEKVKQYSSEFEKIMKKYSMLRLVTCDDNNVDELLDYINLVHNNSKEN